MAVDVKTIESDEKLFDPKTQTPPKALRAAYFRIHWWHNFLLALLVLCLLFSAFSMAGGPSLVVGCIGVGLAWYVRPALTATPIIEHFQARPLDRVFQGSPITHAVATISQRAELSHIPKVYGFHSLGANAFASGERKSPALILSDGLLRALGPRQLQGVVAHEISHIRVRDVEVSLFADTIVKMTTFVSIFGLFFVVMRGIDFHSTLNSIWFAVLLCLPVGSFALCQYLARVREFRADLGAVLLTGDPRGLAQALARVEYMRVPWFLRIIGRPTAPEEPELLRSHPSTQVRIERLMKLFRTR